jgi:mannose/fructose/N-acetylgalactosamine-specific phosphotransferase system component IIC
MASSTSIIQSTLNGGISVISDLIAASVLAYVLSVTTQQEFIALLAVELLIALQPLVGYLTRFFDRDDTLSPKVERVILRALNVVSYALVFVLIRVAIVLFTELFQVSQIRWHEIVSSVFLLIGFIFILFERNVPPPPPKAAPAEN